VARGLPTGTVTFLFTDVEGSTTLLQRLGDAAYAEALAEHHALLRGAFAAHEGVEVDTQGDAFFCVFASARDAVACACDAQQRLASAPMRVRMGVHSGEAIVADDQYVGLEVHRAARLAAAGHGGQILVSAGTAGQLEPESFALQDLGEHRLKDLSTPLRIYQIGDASFPALKTLRRTNLPTPATPFVGRQRDLATVHAAVRGARLVTLTGPGGTGKTRLALRVSGELRDAFPGGVFWVPLAALREPSLVPPAAAAALGVKETSADLVEAIANGMTAPALLLLDNCEHLLDGVASLVAPLLAGTRDLRIIATSREPLGLTGEHVVPVDPLDRGDAVQLFVSRAEAAGADDLDRERVGALCERLDGLPLAIELAAARAAALPPEVMLERLPHHPGLLRGGRDAEERQRTLEATIGWSYDLLSPEEQRVFRGLSIFAGSSSLSAIEDVVEADVEDLASLVTKSLVRVTVSEDEPRYWLLETIRQFAAEQLDEREREALRARYVRWFAALAVAASAALGERSAVAWLRRLDADVGNLRNAFALALERGDGDAVAVGTTLGEFHGVRGRFGEAQDTLTATLERARTPLEQAKLHHLLGSVLVRRQELSAAASEFVAAEELLGVPANGDAAWWRAWLDLELEATLVHYWTGDVAALHAALDELEPYIERHGTVRERASFLSSRVVEAIRRERYVASAETEQLARESCTAAEAAGDWDGHFQLGFILLWRGKFEEASRHLRLGRAAARSAGDALIEIRCLLYDALAQRRLGEVEAVRALDAEVDELEDTYGYGSLILSNRAWLAWRDGELDTAEALATRAVAELSSESHAGVSTFQWVARFPLLAVDVGRGRLDAAAVHAAAMTDESQQPLRPDVRELVEEALRTGTPAAFEHAIEAGRRNGYA
jgi:predicted ATPase/class 3 adenylate cyclase